MLFRDIIIGPIHSRRLGTSLGVNLLRPEAKICTFNCIYCECGLNFVADSKMPTAQEVHKALEQRLKELKEDEQHIDVIALFVTRFNCRNDFFICIIKTLDFLPYSVL